MKEVCEVLGGGPVAHSRDTRMAAIANTACEKIEEDRVVEC